MRPRIHFDESSKLTCPHGKQFYHYYIEKQFLRFGCVSCNSSSYNAIDVVFIRISDTATQSLEKHNIICHPCPYQASCRVGAIQSKGNYWGLSDDSGKVTFYSCPPLYCCSSLETCESYNTCSENRVGRLCGDCQEGHVLSLFTHNKYIDNSCCDYSWTVWLGYLFLVALICLFFLYNKDVLNYIMKRTQNENATSLYEEDIYQNNNEEFLIASSPFREKQPTSHKLPGIIKITFFFYQTASIIRVVASAKTYYHMPNIVSILFTFFNIKLDFTSSFIKICPLCTNSIVVMDALKSSLSLACLVMLLLAMLICVLVKCVRGGGLRKEVRLKLVHTHSYVA